MFLFVFQLILSTTFLLAATGKLLFGDQFKNTLRLSYFPEPVVISLAIVVPCLELLIGLWLLLAPTPPFLS
jgi:uncharacterized membrane protein YphA (DoxX/SURF4 family)